MKVSQDQEEPCQFAIIIFIFHNILTIALSIFFHYWIYCIFSKHLKPLPKSASCNIALPHYVLNFGPYQFSYFQITHELRVNMQYDQELNIYLGQFKFVRLYRSNLCTVTLNGISLFPSQLAMSPFMGELVGSLFFADSGMDYFHNYNFCMAVLDSLHSFKICGLW